MCHLVQELSLTASANPAQISSARSGSLVTGDYLCPQWLGLQHPKAAGDWQETGDKMKNNAIKKYLSGSESILLSLENLMSNVLIWVKLLY